MLLIKHSKTILLRTVWSKEYCRNGTLDRGLDTKHGCVCYLQDDRALALLPPSLFQFKCLSFKNQRYRNSSLLFLFFKIKETKGYVTSPRAWTCDFYVISLLTLACCSRLRWSRTVWHVVCIWLLSPTLSDATSSWAQHEPVVEFTAQACLSAMFPDTTVYVMWGNILSCHLYLPGYLLLIPLQAHYNTISGIRKWLFQCMYYQCMRPSNPAIHSSK